MGAGRNVVDDPTCESMIMKRPTDKQLFDAIEDRLSLKPSHEFSSFDSFALSTGALTAYAQLRALERLADNVFNLTATLAVIRADHLPVEQKLAQEAGARAREEW